MKKSVLKRIKSFLSGMILIASCLLLVLAIFARVSDRIPRIFGYSFHIVVTDSMTPEINVGDFVVAKKIDISDVKIGDDVVFKSPDPNLNGKVILHRVEDINAQGELITSGIKEGAITDNYPVSEIIGIYTAKSAFLGSVFTFLQRPENLIFIIIALILVYATYRLAVKVVALVKESSAAELQEGIGMEAPLANAKNENKLDNSSSKCENSFDVTDKNSQNSFDVTDKNSQHNAVEGEAEQADNDGKGGKI